ncbi:MAG: hypothetical protein Q9216_001695 [Gyalolechia sp. 2 TL-2023]
MGLSAPRKYIYTVLLFIEIVGQANIERRANLSRDPNNTAWSRSPARFGEKLLLSQGWRPGSLLGAQCATYVNNPASSSHIRINAKDNNLGLGAKNGGPCDDGPTTGLDGLQNLLGRLNGKDEELLEKEHRRKEAYRRNVYAEQRWGFGNFISGGFLVGDRIYLEEAESREVSTSITNNSEVTAKVGIIDQGSLKGKKRSGKESESKALRDPSNLPPKPGSTGNSLDERVIGEGGGQQTKLLRADDDHTLEARQRLEKLERKAQRRARKAEKLAGKASKHKGHRPPDPLQAQVEPEKQASVVELGSAQRSHGRHAVRQRFIQHKKMSLADQRALNEVWGFPRAFVSMLTILIDTDDKSLVPMLPAGLG